MHLRELFGKDLHHARYIGIFFEFFDLRGRLFFRCIVADEERGEDFGKEFAFCPKTEIGPNAFECDVDISIDEDDFGAGSSPCLGGPDEFRPRFDAEFRADLALKCRYRDIGEQIEEFPFSNDVEDVELFPAICIVKAIVSLLAQFHTNLIGVELLDESLDFGSARLTHVSRPYNMVDGSRLRIDDFDAMVLRLFRFFRLRFGVCFRTRIFFAQIARWLNVIGNFIDRMGGGLFAIDV